MEAAGGPLHYRRLRQVLRAGLFGLGRRRHLEVLMSIRIAVLGAGNMGGALVGGIANRVTKAANIVATTRTPERAAELVAKYGARATAGGNRQAAAGADLVGVAVKPGTLPKVLTEIRDALDSRKI